LLYRTARGFFIMNFSNQDYLEFSDTNTEEFAKSLKTSIDGGRYATLISSLGKTLNSRKDRFDKSDIIEQSLEVYSDNRLIWVDDVGRDHYDSITGYDIEFKYQGNLLFTKSGKKRNIVKVKLKNSLGKHKGIAISDPADFYMFGQENAIAIISWEEIKQYLVAVPDGIEAHVPHDSLKFVFLPHEVTVSINNQIDYKQLKAEAQRKLIESIY